MVARTQPSRAAKTAVLKPNTKGPNSNNAAIQGHRRRGRPSNAVAPPPLPPANTPRRRGRPRKHEQLAETPVATKPNTGARSRKSTQKKGTKAAKAKAAPVAPPPPPPAPPVPRPAPGMRKLRDRTKLRDEKLAREAAAAAPKLAHPAQPKPKRGVGRPRKAEKTPSPAKKTDSNRKAANAGVKKPRARKNYIWVSVPNQLAPRVEQMIRDHFGDADGQTDAETQTAVTQQDHAQEQDVDGMDIDDDDDEDTEGSGGIQVIEPQRVEASSPPRAPSSPYLGYQADENHDGLTSAVLLALEEEDFSAIAAEYHRDQAAAAVARNAAAATTANEATTATANGPTAVVADETNEDASEVHMTSLFGTSPGMIPSARSKRSSSPKTPAPAPAPAPTPRRRPNLLAPVPSPEVDPEENEYTLLPDSEFAGVTMLGSDEVEPSLVVEPHIGYLGSLG